MNGILIFKYWTEYQYFKYWGSFNDRIWNNA